MPLRRIITLVTLIVAGEAIFFLPFVIARIFRPTLLEVFDLTNFQLGTAMSTYGVVAMIAYLPGGPLADRFSARRLLSIALISTSLGGIALVSSPSIGTLKILYGFWGLTTILLFWAALIRATREWGGDLSQGRAFGFLDGGRGLVTALMGTMMVAVFASQLPGDGLDASLLERSAALKKVIWYFTGFTFTAAILVWFTIPEVNFADKSALDTFSLSRVRHVLKIPAVWLQAIIIVCAYVGYKATDDFSLYAKDALGFDDVAAAKAGTFSLWVRPVAAISAGLIADRISPSKLIVICFALLFIGGGVIASGKLAPGMFFAFFFTVTATSAAIFALRGLYFSIMGEAGIPLAVTGTAVGIVSLLGYTPDIFMGPIMGYLLDRSPGELGHQHLFAVISGFSIIGFITAMIFRRFNSEVSGKSLLYN